ncbi:ATP-grasp domain-containing protein [Chitinophaga rhizophila]|uniref:ATP-grasp domain-containing protein n=1 Tax=Chitinophaga rhizophila TaxID=2866212 RepID=A0ABS7GA12_9BACT|nr:ATP-grasp domain-containing protein [Chitinophaga rhizophila]MBW8684498.1 ATP-grasp domain-containing protein [Chitinophaga rhizophila]
MSSPATLLIPEKTDIEFEQVEAAWRRKGGSVMRLGKYWVKDEQLSSQSIAIYGNQTFALVLAQIYNVNLLSPDDALIAEMEVKWSKRTIQLLPVSKIGKACFPAFVKPVIPKLFLAGIFYQQELFNDVITGLQHDELVLMAEIIHDIKGEARSYVLQGIILDLAWYEGEGDLSIGYEFLTEFVCAYQDRLPVAVVIDIAFSEERGWFILEFNGCWGAGLNNCNAEKVIDCIANATIPA